LRILRSWLDAGFTAEPATGQLSSAWLVSHDGLSMYCGRSQFLYMTWSMMLYAGLLY
jgi:hypothetical protein